MTSQFEAVELLCAKLESLYQEFTAPQDGKRPDNIDVFKLSALPTPEKIVMIKSYLLPHAKTLNEYFMKWFPQASSKPEKLAEAIRVAELLCEVVAD